MSKGLPQLILVSPATPQLQCVNEKIAALAAVMPWGDIYGTFSFAGHIATEAINAAEELKQMPGVDLLAFQAVPDFWHRVRDYNYAAALAVAGGNQTLPEALVVFRFLRNCRGDR